MLCWRRKKKGINADRLPNEQPERPQNQQAGRPQDPHTGRVQDVQSSEPQDEQLNTQGGDFELGSMSVPEREGLFTFDTRSTQDYNIDIVAVHGLGGHWEGTWEGENGRLWLRDFLPAQLPRARIMSYGYNSDTVFSKAITNIDDEARMLLDRLDGERGTSEQQKRPVIFISHSLGGIVVKKALIIAHERSNIYKNLLDSVRGCVFFGVPHRGSDAAYWGSFVASLLNVPMLGRTNRNFVTALQRNSEAFSDISQQFIERGAMLQIRTFYETTTYCNQLIVDKNSACLGLVNEIAVGVAGANHRDICKFTDARSQKYLHVGRAIEKLVNSIVAPEPSTMPLSDEETECLRYLYTSNYESHKNSNPTRTPGTLGWFLEHEKYQHWRQEQKSSLLWVSADPGCGKSVLASFLVDEFSSPEFQSVLPSTVCFFFYKDGYEEQNNAVSALCALLHQILKAKSSLIKHAIPQFKQKGQRFIEEFDALWKVFKAVTTDSDCDNIICVIDGLDECGELSRNQFIDSIVKIYTQAELRSQGVGRVFLKFIATSRPYHSIERRFKSLPSIRLKVENEIPALSTDIDLVIKVGVGELGRILGLTDEIQIELQDKLLRGADRTFLWVSLILNILRDALMASASEFDTIINSLPSDLDATYEKILGKCVDPKKAKTILHIIVAAVRPLTLEEMGTALAIRPGHKSIEDLKFHRMFDTESGVKNLCGLFVRVIDSKIYLVHQTAKEFLINNTETTLSTAETWKHSLNPVESHLTLARICICYLLLAGFETHPLRVGGGGRGGWGDVVKDYTKQHNLLGYAAECWVVHIQESQIMKEHELWNDVLGIFDTGSGRLLTWFQVYWYATANFEEFPSSHTPLMVASYIGLEVVVRLLIERGSNVNSRCEPYGSALNTAAFRNHHAIIQILFDNGAIVYLYGQGYENLPQKSLEDFEIWLFRFRGFERFIERFIERFRRREEIFRERTIVIELPLYPLHCDDHTYSLPVLYHRLTQVDPIIFILIINIITYLKFVVWNRNSKNIASRVLLRKIVLVFLLRRIHI